MEESLNKTISAKQAAMYSPLTLAYLGDSVLDLMVKEHFVRKANQQVQKYHKEVTSVVSAVHQAEFIESIEVDLTEEEIGIYHRGRNASVHTKAKNASMAEYKKATGLEALLGYLYLSGQTERLQELVCAMLERQDEERK